MSRSINTKKHFENENMRKEWKDLGRLNCLIRQVSQRRFGAESMLQNFLGATMSNCLYSFERRMQNDSLEQRMQNEFID